MLIDFHTHAFPDKIASRTVASLASVSGLNPYTDGTAAGLRERLTDSGVGLGVVLPVVTRAEQFDSINRFAAEINASGDGLISFGGIHPDDPVPEEHIRHIKSLGLRGIKLHPDYQGTYIDDGRYVKIISLALDAGLTVVTHAGIDVGFPGHPVRCTPERAERLLDVLRLGDGEIPLVLAHGGGYAMHSEVMEHLAGKGVYFDLSMTYRTLTKDELTALVRKHGAKRLLFGSDCPWGEPAETAAFIRGIDITDGEKQMIFEGNARRLLCI